MIMIISLIVIIVIIIMYKFIKILYIDIFVGDITPNHPPFVDSEDWFPFPLFLLRGWHSFPEMSVRSEWWMLSRINSFSRLFQYTYRVSATLVKFDSADAQLYATVEWKHDDDDDDGDYYYFTIIMMMMVILCWCWSWWWWLYWAQLLLQQITLWRRLVATRLPKNHSNLQQARIIPDFLVYGTDVEESGVHLVRTRVSNGFTIHPGSRNPHEGVLVDMFRTYNLYVSLSLYIYILYRLLFIYIYPYIAYYWGLKFIMYEPKLFRYLEAES